MLRFQFFLSNPFLRIFYFVFLRGLLRRFIPTGPKLLPTAIVLAVGGPAAGGPEAIRLSLAATGRSAVADIAICLFLIFAYTTLLLGTMLLARLFDVVRAMTTAPAPDPDTDMECFAGITLTVSLVTVFFVTICLVVAPSIPAKLGNEHARAARSCPA